MLHYLCILRFILSNVAYDWLFNCQTATYCTLCLGLIFLCQSIEPSRYYSLERLRLHTVVMCYKALFGMVDLKFDQFFAWA